MYTHFAQRLKERYDLDITPLEYIDLIQSQYETIEKQLSVGKKIVKVKFKGKIILAVKQAKKNQLLITALPYNGHLKESLRVFRPDR